MGSWIEKAIELVDHGDIDNHVVKASARAELAEKDARIERLTAALEHIKRHQEILGGSFGRLGASHKIAVAALSGAPTTTRVAPITLETLLEIAQAHPLTGMDYAEAGRYAWPARWDDLYAALATIDAALEVEHE
jgi:hypothetical protein